MPTPTYTPLATVTLGSSAASVTFGSIPATYRDLIVVIAAQRVTNPDNVKLRFNGDTGSNYNSVFMYGDGATPVSQTRSGTFAPLDAGAYPPNTGYNNYIVNIMDYSATDKHKTVLNRANHAPAATEAWASRWANTAAITSMNISIIGGFNTGSTFSLYGVIA
jgi:hypothetical protein